MVRRHPTAFTAGSPQLSAGRGRKQKRSVITLDEFTSAVYLPHIAMRKRSWSLDERILRQHISPVFGARKLAAIERQDVEDWLCRLTSGGLAPATCNRALSVFKTLCQEAVLRGFLPAGQSPCAGVSPLKGCTLRESYLTEEEAQKLMRRLEQCGRPEASALRLLLLTGARKSEILRARWENVRTDLRLLIVPLSKSGRPRHIPLSAAAIAVAQSSPPRARQPLALPRKSPRKASQRSLFLLEQYPEGTGTRRRAHSRPAAFIRQFSREFRPFAVRGPETAGTQRSENDHALCPSGTGTASGRRRNSQRLPQDSA